MFSIGLLIFFSAFYAFKHNVQIVKVGGSTCVGVKPATTAPATTTGFKCPGTEWVDCMPVVGPTKKVMCSAAYLNWAKQNCPKFKGAAL